MRFALLGDSPGSLMFARAVVEHAEHDLVGTVHAPQSESELMRTGVPVKSFASWEELVSDPAPAAVIVGGTSAEVLAACKQLAAAQRWLWVFPQAQQSSTFVYELSLEIVEDSPRHVPLLPHRAHPYVQRVRDLLRAADLGTVHHLELERQLAPGKTATAASPSTAPLMSTVDLQEALLVDLDLLRYLVGEYNQVTASRSGEVATGVSRAAVTLAGDGLPQAHWTSAVARAEPHWRLTIAGERGTATLTGDPQACEFALEIATTAAAQAEPPLRADWGSWYLRQLLPSGHASPLLPVWNDAVRLFELLDGVERSLRRRRTIDVHFEAPSERNQFKSQMTAIGCSVLMLTLFLMVLFLTIATVFEPNDSTLQLLRVLTFLPLGLFLGAQLLYFITRPTSRAPQPPPQRPRSP